jgi:hypothetical protein
VGLEVAPGRHGDRVPEVVVVVALVVVRDAGVSAHDGRALVDLAGIVPGGDEARGVAEGAGVEDGRDWRSTPSAFFRRRVSSASASLSPARSAMSRYRAGHDGDVALHLVQEQGLAVEGRGHGGRLAPAREPNAPAAALSGLEPQPHAPRHRLVGSSTVTPVPPTPRATRLKPSVACVTGSTARLPSGRGRRRGGCRPGRPRRRASPRPGHSRLAAPSQSPKPWLRDCSPGERGFEKSSSGGAGTAGPVGMSPRW